jgi:hypothetical protein
MNSCTVFQQRSQTTKFVVFAILYLSLAVVQSLPSLSDVSRKIATADTLHKVATAGQDSGASASIHVPPYEPELKDAIDNSRTKAAESHGKEPPEPHIQDDKKASPDYASSVEEKQAGPGPLEAQDVQKSLEAHAKQDKSHVETSKSQEPIAKSRSSSDEPLRSEKEAISTNDSDRQKEKPTENLTNHVQNNLREENAQPDASTRKLYQQETGTSAKGHVQSFKAEKLTTQEACKFAAPEEPQRADEKHASSTVEHMQKEGPREPERKADSHESHVAGGDKPQLSLREDHGDEFMEFEALRQPPLENEESESSGVEHPTPALRTDNHMPKADQCPPIEERIKSMRIGLLAAAMMNKNRIIIHGGGNERHHIPRTSWGPGLRGPDKLPDEFDASKTVDEALEAHDALQLDRLSGELRQSSHTKPQKGQRHGAALKWWSGWEDFLRVQIFRCVPLCVSSCVVRKHTLLSSGTCIIVGLVLVAIQTMAAQFRNCANSQQVHHVLEWRFVCMHVCAYIHDYSYSSLELIAQHAPLPWDQFMRHQEKKAALYIHTYIHTYIYTPSDMHTTKDAHIHTYICTHVLKHACKNTCTHTYIYTLRHAYNNTYIYTYIHTYTHTQTCIKCPYIHTYIHTHTDMPTINKLIHTYALPHIHTYVHTLTYTYTCTHTHIYIHMYTHSHIHTYVHTHIPLRACTHIYTHAYVCTYTYTSIHIHASAVSYVAYYAIFEMIVRWLAGIGEDMCMCAYMYLQIIYIYIYMHVYVCMHVCM